MNDDPDDQHNPRWKSRKKFWDSVPLECYGKPEGTTVYEEFELTTRREANVQ